MKQIVSGHGNSSDMMGAREMAWSQKLFRYVVISTSGGIPGMIGGSFNYEIRGTNSMRELIKPNIFQNADEVIDNKLRKGIEKTQLAKLYIKSLSKKQKAALVEKTLLKNLLVD